jgi:exodeoxyribonuclease VII large subunit
LHRELERCRKATPYPKPVAKIVDMSAPENLNPTDNADSMRVFGADPMAMRAAVTVSQFVQAVAQSLARNFPLVRISGEISGATRAASGHWYFSLKDSSASVRCVLFKNRALLIGDRLREGDQVEIRARAGLYEPRGEFQLVVDSVQAAGQGDLLAAFVRLKEKLAAEGLFDAANKRALPVFTRSVGIVTSRDAAALRDVVSTFARRAPHVRLTLYPASVQGANAPRELLAAVQTASGRNEVDVLIVCRGGGALEDLAAFNDEALARAIAATPMPVISGVGHETDFSISDFVADLRAPTPTAAAELAARATKDWHSELAALTDQLTGALQDHMDALGQRLDGASARLTHPGQRLAVQAACLALLRERLVGQARSYTQDAKARAVQLHQRVRAARPNMLAHRTKVSENSSALATAARRGIDARAGRMNTLAARLGALDPSRVLARGYTFAADAQGKPITSSRATAPGQALTLHWHDGTRDVEVKK